MLKFGDKVVGKVNIEKELTEDDIDTIISNAFDDGIAYWAGVDNKRPEWKDRPKDEYLSSWATKILIDGGNVKLYDVEGTEDDSEWILTLEKLLKGYKLNYDKRPHDRDIETGDAITSDCIIQYALFDDIIFG